MKDTVTVNIYGENYTLKAGDNPQYALEVAEFVDRQMRDIAANGKVVVTSKIAILAALNIADQLLSQRRDWEAKEQDTGRRIEKLLAELGKAIDQ